MVIKQKVFLSLVVRSVVQQSALGFLSALKFRDHKYSLKIRERTYLNFWCLPTFCTLMFLNGFVLIVQAQPFSSELYKLVFVNLITLSSFPCAFF